MLAAAGDAASGRTIVNLTSGIPEEARTLGAKIDAGGSRYVDGTIMAIPQMIGQPGAFLLYSGSQAAYSALEGILGTLGTGVYLGEDAGLALLYDLALLDIMWATLGGFLHATALVGTEGVKAEAFAGMAAQWLGGVTTFLAPMAQQVDAGDYATDASTVDTNVAGLAHLVAACEAQGVHTDLVLPMKALVDRRAGDGHGAEGLAGLVELIRK